MPTRELSKILGSSSPLPLIAPGSVIPGYGRQQTRIQAENSSLCRETHDTIVEKIKKGFVAFISSRKNVFRKEMLQGKLLSDPVGSHLVWLIQQFSCHESN